MDLTWLGLSVHKLIDPYCCTQWEEDADADVEGGHGPTSYIVHEDANATPEQIARLKAHLTCASVAVGMPTLRGDPKWKSREAELDVNDEVPRERSFQIPPGHTYARLMGGSESPSKGTAGPPGRAARPSAPKNAPGALGPGGNSFMRLPHGAAAARPSAARELASMPEPPRTAAAAQLAGLANADTSFHRDAKKLPVLLETCPQISSVLRVRTGDYKFKEVIFRETDDLAQVSLSFLNRHGLSVVCSSGLQAKMQQMLVSGQVRGEVDIVDLC